MAAQIIFNQTGLGAGTPGARTDGLATGAVVTVTNGSGEPCECELWWCPPEDATAASTFGQVNDSTWSWTPEAARYGSYTVAMYEARGTPDETVDVRIFGIRTPNMGLLIPALNERGDPTVTLASSVALKAAAAKQTYNDEAYQGMRYLAWWKSQADLYMAVEDGIANATNLATTLGNGPSANNIAITNLGAPAAPTSAARLVDLQNPTGGGNTTPPTTLYVAGAGGLDTNDGLTALTALATLERAGELIGTVRANCTIDVSAASPLANGYTMGWLKRPRAWGAGNFSVRVRGTTASEVVVATVTVASSTFQTVTLTTSPATHAYKGLAVRVVTGAQAGQVRAVVNNAAGVCTLMSGFAANLVAGVTLEVFRPGVVLDMRETIVGGPDPYNRVNFENVEFKFDFCQVVDHIGTTGVTMQKPATSPELAFFGGSLQCDTLRGLNWRSTTADGTTGIIDFVGTTAGRIAGVLGNVHTHGTYRAGYDGALNIAGGEVHIYSAGSQIMCTVPIAYQAQKPRLYITDYGNPSAGNGGNPSPCWVNGGFFNMYMPFVLGGTGTSAGRLTARACAYVELGEDVVSGVALDVDQMSGLRIASGGTGGPLAKIVEGVDVSTLGVDFTTAGQFATGDNGSNIHRSN